MFISRPFKLRDYDNSIYWVLPSDDFHQEPCDLYDFQVKELLENRKMTDHPVYQDVKDSKSHEDFKCYAYCMTGRGEDWEIFRAMKPEKKKRPIFNPDHVSVQCQFLTFEECVSNCLHYIGADCWGVFTRDSLNCPVKVYFDSRMERDYGTKKGISEGREYLMVKENLEKDMKEAKEKDLTFCVIMGYDNFIDVYYYPNGTEVYVHY